MLEVVRNCEKKIAQAAWNKIHVEFPFYFYFFFKFKATAHYKIKWRKIIGDVAQIASTSWSKYICGNILQFYTVHQMYLCVFFFHSSCEIIHLFLVVFIEKAFRLRCLCFSCSFNHFTYSPNGTSVLFCYIFHFLLFWYSYL